MIPSQPSRPNLELLSVRPCPDCPDQVVPADGSGESPRWWRRSARAETAKLDPARLRAENRKLLSNLIWGAREISRADLARETGLSRSTVSAIITELLEQGLVIEQGAGTSTGGRRPIVLRFDDTAYGIVGVDLGASHIGVAVTDLRGGVRAWVKRPQNVRDEPEQTLALLSELIREAVAKSLWPLERVLGIGVAAPCPIDPATPDQLSDLVLPAWRGHDLVGALRREFGRPVYLDNDANLGAVAEQWWGAGADGSDLAYIKLATGVGAGFIVDGVLYRGAGGVAGEVGHLVLDPDGALCMCGLRGCLVTLIGAPALVARAEQDLAAGLESALTPGHVTIDALVLAAREGDAVASETVGRAGRQLGAAIANLLTIINPARVVLSGGLTRAGRALFGPLEEMLERRALFSARARVAVVTSRLGESGTALGAATLVLEALLEDEQALPGKRDEAHA